MPHYDLLKDLLRSVFGPCDYDTVYGRDGINIFWSIRILMKFSINLNLKPLRLLCWEPLCEPNVSVFLY